MEKNRLEAFSDGVIAIIITIMVLELSVKDLDAHAGWREQLREILPKLLAYVLSYIYVGIYWNNHHHMLHTVRRVTGGILWANLHLLFWLSLFPFATAWVGANHLAPAPTAVYGIILLMAAIAYYILQTAIIRQQGENSLLKKAIGGDWKGKVSPLCYLAAIPLAFESVWISNALFIFVAILWLIPDRRIELALEEKSKE
jgi:uncharacterized membrane protein